MALRTRLPGALLASILLIAGSASAVSAEDYPVDVQILGTGNQVFVGGDYGWYFDVWGVNEGAALLATMDWGDGTPSTTVATTDADQRIWCDAGHCSGWAPHVYVVQGLFEQTLSVVNAGTLGGSARSQELVVDLDVGGWARGSGIVDAPAGSGGMYDPTFAGGPASFKFEARRRAGTSATTASVTISVPSMTGYNGIGMTFTGKAPLEALYIAPAKGAGAFILRRVYGTVASSGGLAGSAYAMIQARIVNRTTTIVRLSVWNASAGFTYVDTGWQPAAFYGLDPVHDLLESGSVRVG